MKWRVPSDLQDLGPAVAIFLSVVVGTALWLRLWGAFFGLPYVYHPDEGFEIYRALRLGMGGFDLERVSKGGYYFVLFFEYGVYFVVQFLTRAVSGPADFAMQFVRNPTPFWQIGRVTTALLGTGTVFLVWLQAKRMGSQRAGLFGAWFLAVSYQHVQDSHYVTVDIPMAFAAFLAIFLIVEDVAGRTRLRELPWAFVAAFAVLCKLPAVVLFLPYFVGAWLRGRFRGERGLFTWDTIRPALYAAGIYLVLNPGFLVNLQFVLNLVSSTVGGVGEEVNPEYVGAELRENLWRFYSSALLQSQGPGLLALSLVGAAFGLARRSRGAILHLCFIVPVFLLIAGSSSSHLYYFRYIIPMLPGLCLLAGLAGDDLIRRVRWPRAVGSVAAVVLALVLAVEPGGASMRWDARSARMDTRTKAVNWILENVPHQTSVLLEGFPEEMAQLSIPLPNLKRNVRAMIERLRDTDPGKAKFWELKLETLSPPLYDLHTVRRSDPWGEFDDYVAEGVGFVVLRRDFFVRGTARTERLDAEDVRTRHAFYDALVSSEGSERVAAFEASKDGAPGFDIEIWKLPPGELQTSTSTAAVDEDDE